jgi:hypothetical protein
MAAKRKSKKTKQDLPAPLAKAERNHHCINYTSKPEKPALLCDGEDLWERCVAFSVCFPKLDAPQACTHPRLKVCAVAGKDDFALPVECLDCGKRGVYTLTVDVRDVFWEEC